eukprot:COSAG02_NODE_4912_length_4840_cov_10.382061_3_plen_170_part_00
MRVQCSGLSLAAPRTRMQRDDRSTGIPAPATGRRRRFIIDNAFFSKKLASPLTSIVTCRNSDWSNWSKVSQAGSEFNTPRNENNTNFRYNAQQKAATRGGQRGAVQFSVSFPYSRRIQPGADDHRLGWNRVDDVKLSDPGYRLPCTPLITSNRCFLLATSSRILSRITR